MEGRVSTIEPVKMSNEKNFIKRNMKNLSFVVVFYLTNSLDLLWGVFFFFCLFVCFVFSGTHLQHTEAPRLRVESELHLRPIPQLADP